MTPHQTESALSSRQLILLTEQEKAISPEQNISQLVIEQSNQKLETSTAQSRLCLL